MWVLLLNDMRSSKVEVLQPVFRHETKEKLKDYLEQQKVPGYQTTMERFGDGPKGIGTEKIIHTFNKGFKQGGPLEWFNAPNDFHEAEHFIDVGTDENLGPIKLEFWKNNVITIPVVPE